MKFQKSGQMLGAMISLAVQKHDGYYDKSGKPYILHCLAVMYILNSDDEELQCIAVGHDLVEDTDVTYVLLRELGFTERIIAGIDAMTKRRGETLDEYKARVKANPDAILVKKADLEHNSDIKRLKGVTQKDVERMVRYHNFWLELDNVENNLEASGYLPYA